MRDSGVLRVVKINKERLDANDKKGKTKGKKKNTSVVCVFFSYAFCCCFLVVFLVVFFFLLTHLSEGT